MLVLSLFPGIGLLDMAFEQEGFCVVRGPDVIWGGDIRSFRPPASKFDGIIGGPPCQSFSSLAHLVRASGNEPKFGNLIPEFERCVREAQPDWFLMENVRQAPDAFLEGYGVHSFLLNNHWLAGPDGFGQEQERLRKFNFGTRGREAPNLMRWIDLATLWLPKGDIKGSAIGSQLGSDESRHPGSKKNSTPAVSSAHAGHGRSRKPIILGNGDPCPVAIGGSGKIKPTVTSNVGGIRVRMARYTLADACRLQGLPEDFLKDSPFRADGKLKAVANGVPLPMGRAIAGAILQYIDESKNA